MGTTGEENEIGLEGQGFLANSACIGQLVPWYIVWEMLGLLITEEVVTVG